MLLMKMLKEEELKEKQTKVVEDQKAKEETVKKIEKVEKAKKARMLVDKLKSPAYLGKSPSKNMKFFKKKF